MSDRIKEAIVLIEDMATRLCGYFNDDDVDRWRRGPCDCKFGGPTINFGLTEKNGCPELRTVSRLLREVLVEKEASDG